MSLLITKSLRQECQVRVLEKANPRGPASEYCWWCKETTDFGRIACCWKAVLEPLGTLVTKGDPSYLLPTV